MTSFKSRLSELRKGLTRIHDREPLTPLSFAIIIFLDLFVLAIIFGGLSSHTQQLTSPEEYMPYVSRNVFIDKDWSKLNRIAELQQLALVDYHQYHYTYRNVLDDRQIAKMHPLSRDLFLKTKAIAENKELHELLLSRQNLSWEMNRLRADFGDHESMLTPVQGEYEKHHAALVAIDTTLARHPLVQSIWEIIKPGDEARRASIIKDFKLYELKYKFVEFFWQLLFLVPIFGVIYAWHGRSVKRENKIRILISSHLLIVASIPIVFKAIELILDLIPRYFFKKLFEVLELLHIIAIWHYIVIALAVGAALLLIYVVQKKIFNLENLYRQRLEKGQCYACGRKTPNAGGLGTIKICPFCGENQHQRCTSCGKETFIAGQRCIHCGSRSKPN